MELVRPGAKRKSISVLVEYLKIKPLVHVLLNTNSISKAVELRHCSFLPSTEHHPVLVHATKSMARSYVTLGAFVLLRDR